MLTLFPFYDCFMSIVSRSWTVHLNLSSAIGVASFFILFSPLVEFRICFCQSDALLVRLSFIFCLSGLSPIEETRLSRLNLHQVLIILFVLLQSRRLRVRVFNSSMATFEVLN